MDSQFLAENIDFPNYSKEPVMITWIKYWFKACVKQQAWKNINTLIDGTMWNFQNESILPGLISRCKNVKFMSNIDMWELLHIIWSSFDIWQSKVILVIVVGLKENSLYICKTRKKVIAKLILFWQKPWTRNHEDLVLLFPAFSKCSCFKRVSSVAMDTSTSGNK